MSIMNLNSRIEVGMKDGSLLKCEIVESFFFEGSHFVAFKSVEPPKQHAQFFYEHHQRKRIHLLQNDRKQT